jgi:hypothetical protein
MSATSLQWQRSGILRGRPRSLASVNPLVSQQIRGLKEELGVPLFHRVPHSAELTTWRPLSSRAFRSALSSGARVRPRSCRLPYFISFGRSSAQLGLRPQRKRKGCRPTDSPRDLQCGQKGKSQNPEAALAGSFGATNPRFELTQTHSVGNDCPAGRRK